MLRTPTLACSLLLLTAPPALVLLPVLREAEQDSSQSQVLGGRGRHAAFAAAPRRRRLQTVPNSHLAVVSTRTHTHTACELV